MANSNRKKAVTLKDIAHATGVSVTTVSHVLNKTRHVNSETRKSVLSALDTLAYDTSNRSAKRARVNKALLGVIIADIREDYYVSLVKAIETVASEYGMSLLLCDSEMDSKKEEKNIQTMLEREVSGIIIAPIDVRFFPTELRDTAVPIVLVDRQYDKHNRMFVGINNHESGFLAYSHLAKKGCKKIAFIGYAESVYTVQKRISGYKSAVYENQTQSEPAILNISYGKEDSFTKIYDFLQGGQFDGLVCATSDICYEVISVIDESHLRIPEDIRIITYDDNKWLDYLKYPVSVITQPTADIGAFAVEKIVQFNESPIESSKIRTEVFFEVSFIDR